MKKVGLPLAFLALSTVCSLGQVTVEVQLEQEQFLPGESLPVAVRITNRSGQVLKLGAEDWLTFSIEDASGLVLPQIAQVPVVGEFELETSKRATKHVDLSPSYALSRQGRYTIIATVKIKQWEQQVVSVPKKFNLIEGSKMWEQEFGLPQAADATNAVPEFRKYILQQANYLSQLRLYLRITDLEGNKVFRTLPIGVMLSFSRPEMQLDKRSNLHLLYQNWAHSFAYVVFNPNGELLERETYDFLDARPRLQSDNGNISVAGGSKRVTANTSSNSGSAGIPADELLKSSSTSPDNAQPPKP
jgi:hypothetical protein